MACSLKKGELQLRKLGVLNSLKSKNTNLRPTLSVDIKENQPKTKKRMMIQEKEHIHTANPSCCTFSPAAHVDPTLHAIADGPLADQQTSPRRSIVGLLLGDTWTRRVSVVSAVERRRCTRKETRPPWIHTRDTGRAK